jgi:hypothetical protein
MVPGSGAVDTPAALLYHTPHDRLEIRYGKSRVRCR